MNADGVHTIVGEARYAFNTDTVSFELGLSVDDRYQGQGIGPALLRIRNAAPQPSGPRIFSAIPCAPTTP